MKILWGITGSGDKLEDTFNVMKRVQAESNLDIRVAVSKSGEMVVRMYGLWETLQKNFSKIYIEKGPNSPFLAAELQTGKYDLFIVCPTSANTTAKVAHGVADSLISNCVSQALKTDQRVFIYPVDQKPGVITTLLPNGQELTLRTRVIDVENANRLKKMRGITVLSKPEEIEELINERNAHACNRVE